MTERTIESMCRDLLSVASVEVAGEAEFRCMCSMLSKILERTQTSKSIEKRLDAQLDLAALRRDAERWRKLLEHCVSFTGDILVIGEVPGQVDGNRLIDFVDGL